MIFISPPLVWNGFKALELVWQREKDATSCHNHLISEVAMFAITYQGSKAFPCTIGVIRNSCTYRDIVLSSWV
jgi:hypothetical protein